MKEILLELKLYRIHFKISKDYLYFQAFLNCALVLIEQLLEIF